MKWIGAHIWDWVTRFRNDVYIENISETTQNHVIGIDDDGKLTKFDTPDPGTGGATLDNDIVVSNQGEGFSHMLDTTVANSTTLTDVFELILSPYNLTTIRLNSIGLIRESEEGVYDPTVYTYTNSGTLEVGQKFKITQIRYSVADDEQTMDTDVDFLWGAVDVQSGFADDNTSTQNLNAAGILAATVDITTVVSVNGDPQIFKITAVDSEGSSNQLISDTITITVKNRVRVGGSATSAITDNHEATSLYNNVSDASLVSPYTHLTKRDDIEIAADSGMANGSNYTWIMYPNSWGDLDTVYLLPGTDLMIGGDGAWGDKQTFTITNDYGHTVSYNFYRSTIAGAYSNTPTQQKIKLIF